METDDPFTVDVHVRYQDLDTLEHVNNAVYATYLEEARAAYVAEALDLDVEHYSFVLANLELSFERPLTMGEEPTVAVETTDLGDTSATMEYAVTADGETVATGETTLVYVDPDAKRPAPIPEDVRRRIVEYEGLEE